MRVGAFLFGVNLIHLFAGGESVKKIDMSKIEGLKVFINFAFLHFDDSVIDILIWGDDFVGKIFAETFKERPKYQIYCHRGNASLADKWINGVFQYPQYHFTLSWALMWLKENYPNEKIVIYGLDGGTGSDYYDGWNKGIAFHPTPPEIERIAAINRCYKNLDDFKDRENIYVAKGSAYKGFPAYEPN